MPGLYDSLDAAILHAGPRRVTVLDRAEGFGGYCIHATPPPHVPPLVTDEPEEAALTYPVEVETGPEWDVHRQRWYDATRGWLNSTFTALKG